MKLHIGCGQKYLEGFKHVDILDYDHIDYKTDAASLSMIEDETVDEIYAAHILEHFGRFETSEVLCEWNRVLKKGGVLRIAVPDFEAICNEYIENKTDIEKLMGLLYGGQNYEYNYHYITFDFKSLEKKLKEAGFENMERYDWKEFLPEEYDDFSRAYLPHMDFDNGRLMSLNVIARKNG